MQPVTAIDTVFYYLIDLHYSQTYEELTAQLMGFTTL